MERLMKSIASRHRPRKSGSGGKSGFDGNASSMYSMRTSDSARQYPSFRIAWR